jgi:hypothetical protein
VAPNVTLVPLSVGTEMDLVEFASRVFPPFARPDSGVAFGFVFTSAMGFVSVAFFSF